MKTSYVSTRNLDIHSSFSNAVLQGISPDGGLFTPLALQENKIDINSLLNKSYQEIAYEIIKLFADDFSSEELKNCISKAYTNTFSCPEIVNLSKIEDNNILELYHGPTSAFKDLALQILPQFMQTAIKKNRTNNKIQIIIATSGDTGKAALEGFKDIENINACVLYPKNLVSEIQEKQMITTSGKNIVVCSVNGNFDDCQKMIKQCFCDKQLIDSLSKNNISMSSANSINIGRLCPQVVYYFYSYIKLIENGTIENGDKINFVVPTGNFGNILAAYFAMNLGLPINKLICASNENSVLTDFLNTGIYNRNRQLYKTISPSMDILVSSNVERLLFELYDHDASKVKSSMESLETNGSYSLSKEALEKAHKTFVAAFCSNIQTKETIKSVYDKTGRIIDPHTAVAYKICDDYKKSSGDKTPTIVVSTASCYKFSIDVYKSITDKTPLSEMSAMKLLETMGTESIPKNLAILDSLEVLHTKNINKEDAILLVKEITNTK